MIACAGLDTSEVPAGAAAFVNYPGVDRAWLRAKLAMVERLRLSYGAPAWGDDADTSRRHISNFALIRAELGLKPALVAQGSATASSRGSTSARPRERRGCNRACLSHPNPTRNGRVRLGA